MRRVRAGAAGLARPSAHADGAEPRNGLAFLWLCLDGGESNRRRAPGPGRATFRPTSPPKSLLLRPRPTPGIAGLEEGSWALPGRAPPFESARRDVFKESFQIVNEQADRLRRTRRSFPWATSPEKARGRLLAEGRTGNGGGSPGSSAARRPGGVSGEARTKGAARLQTFTDHESGAPSERRAGFSASLDGLERRPRPRAVPESRKGADHDPQGSNEPKDSVAVKRRED